MKEPDGFCEECLCHKCGNRNCCDTWEGNTKWYCEIICNGDIGCMAVCSRYKPKEET